MSPDLKRALTQKISIELLRLEVPGAPAGAVGPPSKWWTTAEILADAIEPVLKRFHDV